MQDPLPRLVDHEFAALRDRGVVIQEVRTEPVLEVHPYHVGSILTGLAGMAPGTDAEKFLSGGWDPLVGTEFADHDPDRYSIFPRAIKRDWIDRNRDSYGSSCFTERFMNEVKVLDISCPQPSFTAWEMQGAALHNSYGTVYMNWGPEAGESIWDRPMTRAGEVGDLFGINMVVTA
jgi:hypothetical protein